MTTLNAPLAPPAPPPPPPFDAPTLSYQTPSAYAANAVWAQGNKVLANDCTVFPTRCIGCNGNDRLKMQPYSFTWAPPYLYVALLLGLIPGAILVMLAQRKCKVKMATCGHCRHKILMRQLITVGILCAAFGAFFLGAVVHRYFAFAGLGILLSAIIYGITATRLYTVAKIKNDIVTLKGLSRDFVGSLDQR